MVPQPNEIDRARVNGWNKSGLPDNRRVSASEVVLERCVCVCVAAEGASSAYGLRQCEKERLPHIFVPQTTQNPFPVRWLKRYSRSIVSFIFGKINLQLAFKLSKLALRQASVSRVGWAYTLAHG